MTIIKAKTSTLLEHAEVAREYGFMGAEAIIDHPQHGRLYICDGFGGTGQLRGGAVRWEHGLAVKLHSDDTLKILHANCSEILDRACHGYDDSRAVLNWSGLKVSQLAKSLGI